MRDQYRKNHKKALLVYPAVPKNTYWSFEYALQFVDRKSAMPPLGLVTVAALFPDDWELKLVDLNIQALTEADVAWADAVFMSAMIVQKKSFQECVALCRRLQTPVIAGGPYATSGHEGISGVDHFVLGEVESTFAAFLHDFENGCAQRVYQAPAKPDIRHTPVPRFDLLNLSAYRTMSVQYSRGCPFQCEFCDIWRVYGNRPRLKSAGCMLAELDALFALGWRGPVFMVDDNFIGNRKKVKQQLLPALCQWQQAHGFPYGFLTEASINLASDDDLLRAMRKAGFQEVFIGIETPSLEALKETGKTHNLQFDMAAAVRRIQKSGIEVMAGFIVGFDNEGEDIAERQIAFIQKCGIPQAMVGLLTALPGTKLYSRLQKEGRLLHDPEGNNTHADAMNFKPLLDPAIVRDAYKRILGAVYDKNLKNYFERCSRLLDVLAPAMDRPQHRHLKDLRILARSLLFQPFKPYGRQYLKFLLKSLFQPGPAFTEAVRLSIVGHHFYVITQEMLKVEATVSFLDERYAAWRERIVEYREALSMSYGEKRRAAADLLRQKHRILNEARRHIQRIHVDFRGDIARRYRQTADHMQSLMVSARK